MSWQAVVESWPSETLLFVPQLPGFQINAASSTDAADAARDHVGAYVQWLLDGELAEDLAAGEDVTVVEELRATSDVGPIFQLDSLVPDQDETELALAVGRAALSDLLFVFDDVPPEQRAAAEQILRHIAEMDRWYATRMAPAQGKPFALIEDELVQFASLFEETIDAVTASNHSAVWLLDAEAWSVRKILRRRTGHLREHLPGLLALTG